jgi:hypothetical protein
MIFVVIEIKPVSSAETATLLVPASHYLYNIDTQAVQLDGTHTTTSSTRSSKAKRLLGNEFTTYEKAALLQSSKAGQEHVAPAAASAGCRKASKRKRLTRQHKTGSRNRQGGLQPYALLSILWLGGSTKASNADTPISWHAGHLLGMHI